MADSSPTTVVLNGRTLIIYDNRKPDFYPYEELFLVDDPVSGKVFPDVLSLVMKDGALYYVSSRDESTFRFTLEPLNLPSEIENSTVAKIITYGNDKFCLYQDTRTDPHKLVVDAKLLAYGNNLMDYSLYVTNSDGNEECISLYLDSTDNFVSDRVPMATISEAYPAYKYPTNCHTTHELSEGDTVQMRIFNNLGNLAAEVTLFVRDAAWHNDLNSRTNPIVKLDATCLQQNGSDFFVYEKQDPSHLNIQPFLRYADGTEVKINIDNQQCFLYGLEDFISSYPGYSQDIVIKYFLSHKENATDPTTVGKRRFLTCTKKLMVVQNTNTYKIKVAVIPVFDHAVNLWKLRFFAYSDRRDTVHDITDLVQYDSQWTFDGSYVKWGTEQHVEFTADLQSVFDTNDPLPVAQAIWITVWDPTTYVRYTFRENADSVYVYGVDGSITRRPVIHYDANLKGYFIPASIFENWEAVVESFYLLARPQYDSRTESEPPTPTHFTIRDAYSGQMLIGEPVPASEYHQLWSMLAGSEDYTGQVLIVEFLEEVDGNFELLFGVPVDVAISEVGYQG